MFTTIAYKLIENIMISPFAGISSFQSASYFGREQDSRVLHNPGARMEFLGGHDVSAMDRTLAQKKRISGY